MLLNIRIYVEFIGCKLNILIDQIYRKADETVERVTKHFSLFMMYKLTLMNMLAMFIGSIIEFLISGKSEESFHLWITASYVNLLTILYNFSL